MSVEPVPYERHFVARDGSGREFLLTIWPLGVIELRIKSGDRWGSPVLLEEVLPV